MAEHHQLSQVPYAENTAIECGNLIDKLRRVPAGQLSLMDLASDLDGRPKTPATVLMEMAFALYDLARILENHEKRETLKRELIGSERIGP